MDHVKNSNCLDCNTVSQTEEIPTKTGEKRCHEYGIIHSFIRFVRTS